MRFPPRLFLVGAVLAALGMFTGVATGSLVSIEQATPPTTTPTPPTTAPAPAPAPVDHVFCGTTGPLAFGQCFVPQALDFDFDASSGPLGENPTGTFIFERLPGHWEGQVTCLQVTGNSAFVGGIITAGTRPVGSGFAIVVVDNTPPAADLINANTPAVPPAANTPNCGVTVGASLQVTGDIVVQDNVIAAADDDNGNGTAEDDDEGNGTAADDDEEEDDSGSANDEDEDNDNANANDEDNDDNANDDNEDNDEDDD